MIRVYLAGPISGLSYSRATDWRDDASKQLPDWIHTLSPMRGKETLKSSKEILDSYQDDPMSSEKGINTRDYNDVRQSSALLVNFLGATKVSIGTVMEIAWAKAFNIPVVCVMEKDNIHQHCMLNNACGFIVETLEQGYHQLVHLVGTDREISKYQHNKNAKFIMYQEEAKRAQLIRDIKLRQAGRDIEKRWEKLSEEAHKRNHDAYALQTKKPEQSPVCPPTRRVSTTSTINSTSKQPINYVCGVDPYDKNIYPVTFELCYKPRQKGFCERYLNEFLNNTSWFNVPTNKTKK